MKKTILFFFSVICISCITQKNTNVNGTKHIYKIGNIWINPINRNQFDKMVNNGITASNTTNDPNIESVSFYASEDNKVMAKKTSLKVPIVNNLRDRFQNISGLLSEADLGYKLISSDSLSVGQNWVFAIEYTEIDPGNKKGKNIMFHIESNKVILGIVTDLNHTLVAKGLVDAFTKELLNVKLNLK